VRLNLAMMVAIGLLVVGAPAAAQDVTPAAEPAAHPETSAATPGRPLLPVGLHPEPKRPTSLPALYAGFGALQGIDLWQTARLIDRDLPEHNPLMASTAGHPVGVFAIKAATTVSTIYFVERLWKSDHRVTAIVTMVAINAATTAVVAHNARQLGGR